MGQPAISVLIPAAGASRRLGRPKQLVKHEGKTLIQGAVDKARALDPLEILVITGANRQATEQSLQGFPVRLVHNPHWHDGLGSSIAAGAAAASDEAAGLMILLCDQWRVAAHELQRLAATWRGDTGRIVCAEAGGRIGPPVIFPPVCHGELRALEGDHGAHSVLETHRNLVLPVAMDNAAFDLDTPDQLDELHS